MTQQKKASLLAAYLLGCSMVALPAAAHSWYPFDCCTVDDCSPIRSMYPREIDGEYVYVGDKGEAILTLNTSIRDSKDHRMHVCIREGKLLCLFLPPVN